MSSSILLNSKKALKVSNIFLSYGFSKGQISHIFKSPHVILSYSQEDILSNILVWNEFELNKKLFTTLTSFPELLTLSPMYIKNRTQELSKLFTKKDINKLLVTCPKIYLDDFDTIKEKVEYIVHKMGVEQNSIVKSEALQFDVTHIMCRHLFMTRAGLYRIKKKSAVSKCPPLNKIFSRNMNTFLKLSGLTNEEYTVFINAYKFEKEELENEDSDEEFSESNF